MHLVTVPLGVALVAVAGADIFTTVLHYEHRGPAVAAFVALTHHMAELAGIDDHDAAAARYARYVGWCTFTGRMAGFIAVTAEALLCPPSPPAAVTAERHRGSLAGRRRRVAPLRPCRDG